MVQYNGGNGTLAATALHWYVVSPERKAMVSVAPGAARVPQEFNRMGAMNSTTATCELAKVAATMVVSEKHTMAAAAGSSGECLCVGRDTCHWHLLLSRHWQEQ